MRIKIGKMVYKVQFFDSIRNLQAYTKGGDYTIFPETFSFFLYLS